MSYSKKNNAGSKNSKQADVRQLRFNRLEWLPIPILLLAIIILWGLNLQGARESIFMLIALNLIFPLLASALVAYLIARSFLIRGAPGLLLLGCGMILWGLPAVGAIFSGSDPNAIVTIHDGCVWLAAFCHLAGVCLSLRLRRELSPTALWLPTGYLIATGAVVFIVLATLASRLPIFFIQGHGGTPLRQLVLTSSIVMFSLTAVLLWRTGRRPLSAFVYWYALAMGLTAVGLLGVLPQSSAGGAVGWTGRVAQFLGGVYMLIAAIASVRESHVWGISLEAILRSNKDRLHLAIEAAHMATWDWDLTNGDVIWNEEHYKILGYEPGEVKPSHESWAARVHPEDLAAAEAQLRRSMKQCCDYTSEYRLLWPDGTLRCAETRGRFESDALGRVVHSFGVLIDVTERRRSERLAQAIADVDEVIHSKMSLQEIMESVLGKACEAIDCESAAISLRQGNQWIVRHVLGLPASFLGTCMSNAEESHALLAIKTKKVFAIDDVACDPRVSDGPMREWDVRSALVAPLVRRDNPIGVLFLNYHSKTVVFSPAEIIFAKRLSASLSFALENARLFEDLTNAKEELEERVRERIEELANRADQLRALASELTITEQRERRRLAKLLHDHLQQILVGSKFRLSMLGSGADEQTKQGIRDVVELINESIRVSRSLTAELSPPILHEAGLKAGLEWLVKRMADTHDLLVNLGIEQIGNLPETLSIQIFETARELLFNVVKHAGVRSACVILHQIDDVLELIVSDEGAGFDPISLPQVGESGAGYGLFSIRERLYLLGGRLEIQSAPGQGSRFIVTMPIEHAAYKESSPKPIIGKAQITS